MWLSTVQFDVRNVIQVDRTIFKKPFIPSVIWKSLGDEVTMRWISILKLYRIDMYFEHSQSEEHYVVAEHDPYGRRVKLIVYFSDSDSIENLKFMVIQAILHEFVHEQQCHIHESLYDDVHPDEPDLTTMVGFVSYISEKREVQAFSHCAFLEYMQFGEFPTRTMHNYDTASIETKKSFYKYVCRWARKYGESLG